MEKREFDQDYEDLIGDCTIVEMDLFVADDAALQKYVGKTVADLEADGISPNGFMKSGNNVTLMFSKGACSICIEYGDDAADIVSGLSDPDTSALVEALKDCPIKEIYYVM